MIYVENLFPLCTVGRSVTRATTLKQYETFSPAGPTEYQPASASIQGRPRGKIIASFKRKPTSFVFRRSKIEITQI
jgi:hypothetical protein